MYGAAPWRVGGEGGGGRRRGADFAEGLAAGAAAFAVARNDRVAALRGEQRREGPAAEHFAQNALLAHEDLGRVVHREVVDELDVEALRSVVVLRCCSTSSAVLELVACDVVPVPSARPQVKLLVPVMPWKSRMWWVTNRAL